MAVGLQVGFYASSPLLSMAKFTHFGRTFPSDEAAASILAAQVASFGWTYIGVLHVRDAWANAYAEQFSRAAATIGERLRVDTTASWSEGTPSPPTLTLTHTLSLTPTLALALALTRTLALALTPVRAWTYTAAARWWSEGNAAEVASAVSLVRDAGVSVLILICSEPDIRPLLDAAEAEGMLTAGFVWIAVEASTFMSASREPKR